MNDWTAFGRVDADGTVYVKTAEGDRVVGSWQAGTPEEGLAHFARRFADLVTEVDLVEARLKSGAADATHSLASVKRLRATLDVAHDLLALVEPGRAGPGGDDDARELATLARRELHGPPLGMVAEPDRRLHGRDARGDDFDEE